ncbi:hypothetical protein C8J56DRAFT_771636 [Mycena floridula]|nr:hypothetical protein C8J56DRAFT_771636 [Mycena floridula]
MSLSKLKYPKNPTALTIPDLPKIKKWNWTGPLSIAGQSKPICQVELSDAVAMVHNGMPFKIPGDSMTEIVFERLYAFHEANEVLGACGPIQRVARLVALDGKEKLAKWIRYIDSKEMVCLIFVLDSDTTAMMLFLTPGMMEVINRFKIPSELRQNSDLLVGLFSWTMSCLPGNQLDLSQHPADVKAKYFPGKDRPNWETIFPSTSALQAMDIQLALRILRYPQWLDKYMRSSHRQYFLWPLYGTGVIPYEVSLLRTVLKTYSRCKEVGPGEEVKAIFVHVGALKEMHRIPMFADRLSKRLDVCFVIFGTDPDIHPLVSLPKRMHEIFPVGGVVTFTATALMTDTLSILERINQIEEHPLWASYIIPSVLGLAVKLVYHDRDPLEAFDNNQFVFGFLLTAINDGKIALLRAPPDGRNPQSLHDSVSWQDQEFTDKLADFKEELVISQFRTPRQMIQFCVDEFSSKHGTKPREEWTFAVRDEMITDMLTMQIQPAVMKQYRRFVFLHADREPHTFSQVSPFTVKLLRSNPFSVF